MQREVVWFFLVVVRLFCGSRPQTDRLAFT